MNQGPPLGAAGARTPTRQQLEAWLAELDVDASNVLDVGGAQLPVRGRTRTWDVAHYEILDTEDFYKRRVTPDHLWDLNLPCPNAGLRGRFDVIFCLEVMEYIWNPVQALQNMASWAAPNFQAIYLSFHLVYPVHQPVQRDVLRYTRSGIVTLLRHAGLEPAEIRPRMASPDSLVSFWEREKMVGAAGENHDEVGYLVRAVRSPRP